MHTMRKTPPSTISVPYSTTHRIMSPSTLNTANIYDNQCTSLFGDPVPPPADNFFEDLDKNLYGNLRGRSSSTQSNSIVDDFPKANSFTSNGERNSGPSNNRRTPTNRLIRNNSDDQPTDRIFSTSRDRLGSISPTDSVQYPIINTLPGSRYLPQSAATSRPQLLVSAPSHDYGSNDLWNVNIATRSRRLPSELTDDIHLETVRNQIELENRTSRIFPNDPMHYQRRGSNESYSSGEWFKPNADYEEWAKIPRLRPSSKNVMSINQQKGSHHGSPLASLIHGSNGSTSSDEKGSPETVKMRDFSDDAPLVILSKNMNGGSIDDDSPPKELPPPEAAVIPKEIPLPIITNAVNTGSNFRANPPRPHKKPSFSIVAERSPQSSRATSPSPGSGRVSPFLGYGFKEPLRSKTKRKPIQPSKLPNIKDPNNNVNTSDDSVRPLVQFDMSSFSAQNMTKPKVPERTKKKKQQASAAANQKSLAKVHSFESLPKIIKTPAPKLPSRGINKSSLELGSNSKSSLGLPHQNPTSRQKGLLEIFNSAENSPSRIPIKANGASSMEDISTKRRKSLSPVRRDQRIDSISSDRRSSSMTMPRSSIASYRRSSNLSTVTTSDFSFRRHSVSPPRSVIDANVFNIRNNHSPRRVAKPSSLSPIIGTPNKDGQLSTEEKFPTASTSRRSSQSRIPFTSDYRSPSRSNSRVASRNNSRSASLVNSRGPSPSRDFLPISRPNSRVTSRPTSRSSSRADSRFPSRIPSRSNSRNSLNERYAVTNKKASSLSPPKSRKQSATSSKGRSESPRKSPRRSLSPRSVSKSPSPSRIRNLSRTERRSAPTAKSLSPTLRSSSPMKSPNKGREINSNTKITRIPSRKDSTISAKKLTNASKKPEMSVKRSMSIGKGGISVKDNSSSKMSGSNLKRETSNLKLPSSFKRETSTLKRDVPSTKKENSTLKRETSTLKRETSNLKREPSNLKRETSKMKMETSNLKKESLNSKRDTSKLKREGSNLKKESSNVKKEGINGKKTGTIAKKDALNSKNETSELKKTGSRIMKPEQATLKRSVSNAKLETGKLKREPSNLNRDNLNLKDEGTANSTAESTTFKRELSNIVREGSRLSLKKTSSNPIIESVAKAVLVKKRSETNFSKKLEKKSSFRKDKNATTAAEESDASTVPVDSLKEEAEGEDGKADKLIPLTKANVVSMTTAAITAQPVQITTTITNQIPLAKTNSSGQLLSPDGTAIIEMDPVTILEKSQKTLETVQKTVAEASEEIQKAIHENLHDLKVLEGDIGRLADDNGVPFEQSESLTTVLENSAANSSKDESIPAPATTRLPADGGESVSEVTSKPPAKSPVPPTQPIEAKVSVLPSKKSSENLLHPKSNTNNSSSTSSRSNVGDTEDMAERVSERAISVLPEVECESANFQSYEVLNEEDVPKNSSGVNNNNNDEPVMTDTMNRSGKAKSQSGGHDTKMSKNEEGDMKKSDDSQEYLDEEKPKGCCGRFCSKLCIPCRRCQCCSCCKSKKSGSARSDERIIVEEVNEKRSCWGRCCRKKKETMAGSEPHMEQRRMESIQEEPETDQATSTKKQNGCCLCLGKVFCCRKTNKVETTREDVDEVRKCCFCIPCGKKKKPTNAWQERRESIISDPQQHPGCCSRLCTKIFCCCRKTKPVSESRRTSMNSKKQSIIPLEDNRPKLHNDLVDYNSKMKGAIPVMPMWIAWFCMICNCLIPGLGTIFSGFFCICVGIPRFSQYDSAKARIGSLIINCIVGIAQAFCVLFCFVGWGWSIWWGTIMLKMARKLKKIRRVEELEMQEEQRQQAAKMEADLEAQKKEEKK